MTSPSNDDDHFIEMPIVAGRWSHRAQVSSNRLTKFKKPASHGFVRDIEASLCKQILHVSIAQSEAGIEPNGMANDVRWEAVALKADFVHLDRLPQMPVRVRHVIVTMPTDLIHNAGALSPKPRVVVLTDKVGMSSLANALDAGASGYLLKDMSTDALTQSLRLVLMGEAVFPTDLPYLLINNRFIVSRNGAPVNGSGGLSGRETEILSCLVNGASN